MGRQRPYSWLAVVPIILSPIPDLSDDRRYLASGRPIIQKGRDRTGGPQRLGRWRLTALPGRAQVQMRPSWQAVMIQSSRNSSTVRRS